MLIKLLQSKINLLNAQIRQYEDSGLFSQPEIDKLTAAARVELDKFEEQMRELSSSIPDATEIDSMDADYVS